MKIRNTFYNSIANLLYYFLTILLGILNRKAIIEILGIEYQGINGLFSNVLSMLSIAELGIGTAIVYHLYRPLREGDVPTIKSLMQFYKKCYRSIAVIIFILGLLLVPVLPYIVTENITGYTLFSIYIWFLLDAVVSYLFTYKRSILIADQKNYVVVSCDFLYQLAVKLGQIVVLWITRNFLIYLVLMVVCRFVENLLINYLSNQRYPFLLEKDIEPLKPVILKDIKQKVKGMFFHKIGSFIVMGTDNILISRFIGLATVGIYSNYFLVINSIKNICCQILTAATASVGHMLTEGDTEKNYRIFSQMQLLNGLMFNCAATGIYCAATPLITFLFGKTYTVSEFTLFILAFNLYVQGMRTVYSIFKETAGILYEDRFVPIIESAVNIVASIILLKWYGLAGVFMGTIISSAILYGYTYPFLVFKCVLRRNIREYLRELIWMTAILFVSMLSAKILCHCVKVNNQIMQIGINSVISVLVSNGIFFVAYMVWKKETWDLIIKLKGLVKKHK